MKITRKIPALLLAAALTLAAVGCKPATAPGTGTTVKPPATAQHAHGIKDASLYITWGFGSTYCTYALTVTDPSNRVVFTSAGGPATGSTFVVPLVTGKFSAWIITVSSKGRPCETSLRIVDSL